MTLTAQTQDKISEMIGSNDVVLFMKGTKQFPQCGFSATVVQILGTVGTGYATVNVLSDPEVRSGIKLYSDWPTIPQLYIRGEFVGGCDIVKQMYDSGELQNLLGTGGDSATSGTSAKSVQPITMSITKKAKEILSAALADSDPGDVVHLSISANFTHEMDISGKKAGAQELTVDGVPFQFDDTTAKRAGGLTIDYVQTAKGEGFRMDNPNKPITVIEIDPVDIKQKIESGEIEHFYDVRPDAERATASIALAKKLDNTTAAHIESLDKNTPLAFHCHHGSRSRAVASHFVKLGFTEVYNLAGGIEAWSQTVDPTVPTY